MGEGHVFLSVLDQPVVPVLAAPAVLLVVVVAPEPAPPPGRAGLAPESLTEVAASVPFLLVAPWMTSASPGCSADFEVLWLFVILVADDSVTFTVLPEACMT